MEGSLNLPDVPELPLVSCIMPTRNRRAFVPGAIAGFLKQDYPAKELIVVDDGDEPIGDLLPADERVRYVRLDARQSVGAKRNLACERARGSIVLHWDDDDWYAPDRIRRQAAALQREGADVNGLREVLFGDPAARGAWIYAYPILKRRWVYGGTLGYTRAFWRRHRFADVDVGEDALFLWTPPIPRVSPLPDKSLYVARVHPNNVSPKQTSAASWRPVPFAEVERLIGADWTPAALGASDRPVAEVPMPPPLPCRPLAATASPIRNVFACLVHESPACVIDLVRNLRYLDPTSTILLYNGGPDENLLDRRFPWERHGATVYPTPRPHAWGRLHDFALDAMRFCLQHHPFDTLTIVDSDQLLARPGYSARLAEHLARVPGAGLLVNAPDPQPPTTTIGPAAAAFKEIDLWRPFLRQFPDGERAFVHWSFWPSTVFTADAARDLTCLFATNATLREILSQSKIWATEEVVLPTVAALLGHRIVANPCSDEYVRYRRAYTPPQIDAALAGSDVFWIHPVPRRYGDPLRHRLRTTFQQYAPAASIAAEPSEPDEERPAARRIVPILDKMRSAEGWLDDAEAEVLILAARRAVGVFPGAGLVEVGSYRGRGTIVLGCVAKEVCPPAKVVAIDRHDGRTGAEDVGINLGTPTLEAFTRNVARAGVAEVVEAIQGTPSQLSWERPISLLFIDGLHDYPNVAQDFSSLADHVVAGGDVAFHDYADYFPGVKAFVDELLESGDYRRVDQAGSLVVVRKSASAPAVDRSVDRAPAPARSNGVAPLVGPTWLYWEGPRPPYLDLCLRTILRHCPEARLLDRSGFEALWTNDRDVDLDRLSPNHRSDFIRAYLLRHAGGLYLDLDCVVLRSLGPIHALARQRGFAGYREPQGYVSGNLMASVAGGEVIRDHYDRVLATLRSGRSLEWLDLASVPMDQAVASHPEGACLLPTEQVMPLHWNESEALAVRRTDREHAAFLQRDAYCYMLSNNTIRSRELTQPIVTMSEDELLRDSLFISYLLRTALA